ncbi:MAG: hypothetical protein QF876_07985 [Desulfobacterales bacterium]|jgi:hypothetical protein|nr:hypothetical protein [Desulfobacterales bacterium]MDP6808483.1 hypothetical protein [Desulfobacterales bacterium]|tara:strand:+ start:19769 stop:19930 length:162 start_codon:yes stop_codon:yes gene_type:complete
MEKQGSSSERARADLAPPIGVFPAYDEEPGPGIDDTITDPDYPEAAYFKHTHL